MQQRDLTTISQKLFLQEVAGSTPARCWRRAGNFFAALPAPVADCQRDAVMACSCYMYLSDALSQARSGRCATRARGAQAVVARWRRDSDSSKRGCFLVQRVHRTRCSSSPDQCGSGTTVGCSRQNVDERPHMCAGPQKKTGKTKRNARQREACAEKPLQNGSRCAAKLARFMGRAARR